MSHAPADPSSPWRTIVLTMAYDGTNYCGWQSQTNGLAIQDVMERAVRLLTGEAVRVTSAGRTDAGVHALGQLVSFHTQSIIPAIGFQHALQHRLPEDIVIRHAEERPYGFSARFDAVRKRYRYVIHHSPLTLPWLKRYVWWYRWKLNLEAMQAATQLLVGTHDFRCFETEWPNKETSVRTIDEARWHVADHWQPWDDHSAVWRGPAGHAPQPPYDRFLIFDVVADGFLYNMVRSIVGTLVPIGRGRWSPDYLIDLMAHGHRPQAGDTAPAQGLSLIEVEAPTDLPRIAGRLVRYRARQALRAMDSARDLDEVDESAEGE